MSDNNVVEISQESILQRVIREHALAALMVVLVMVTMINGIIIGAGIAVMSNNTGNVEILQRQFEANSAWQARLVGAVEARGIKVPPHPNEEK